LTSEEPTIPSPAVSPSQPNRRRLRTLWKFAAVFAALGVSTSLALLVAEGAVRLVAPQQLIQIRPDLWQPADTLGYVRRPNAAVRINTGERTVSIVSDAQGYRVGANAEQPAPTKVLLLGDSFMEALQVEHEQTMAHQLEVELTKRLGRPVSVRNAGVTGWNPNHYLLRARQLMERDTFALVLVAIFVGNDAVTYRFDRVPPRASEVRKHLRWPKRLSRSELVDALLAPMNDALEVRSHLFILAKNQLSTARMRLGLTHDYLPVEYQRSEASSPRWRNTAEIARDLERAGAAHRTPVLFVLVPERFQVYPDDFQRYLRGFGIDSSSVDVDQPSRLLARAFRAQNLRVVDALAPMRAAAAGAERLYGKVDQHLSPAGHRALTDVVWPEIIALMRR
jgi:hypothetical protein